MPRSFRIAIRKKLLGPLLVVIVSQTLNAQFKVGENPATIQKSSILEMESSRQGLLLPRLGDTAAINSLFPPNGMLIYLTADNSLRIRSAGAWKKIADISDAALNWSKAGNSGTNPATNFVGTTDNQPLAMRTDNQERMRIAADGRVGIGTTAPSTLLHLSGTNPLTLMGVQLGSSAASDSVLTLTNGLVRKLPVGTFQTTLNGTGFVKAAGTTITYDNTTYTPANAAITAGTKTKISYDSKGLVTSGADATTTDILEGTNLYFTNPRVLAAPLSGFSAATATAVTATDTLLGGMGKLQGQINALNSAGYLSANQNITLSGDVTGSGTTAITTTIGANKVTLPHLAQVPTGSFLGRTTAGTGNVEALTTAQAKALLGTSGTNSGDVTLAGQSYLSLSAQTLTAGAIDLSGSHAAGTLAAGRFGALTGDVTNPVGSYATTISTGAVTYNKMQNISATNRLLGRASAGAGSPEEITIGSGLALTGTTLSATGSGMWSTTGNSATTSNFIGTTNNIGFRIRTNNTERLVVDSIGRMGFGVTAPTSPFVFRDTLEIRRVGSVSSLLFSNTANAGDFRIGADGGDIFWQGGGNRNLQMGSFWGIVLSGDRQTASFPAFAAGTTGVGVSIPSARPANIPLAILAHNNQSANLTEWRNGNNTPLSVVNVSGNFGIGNSSPAEKLDITGNLRFSGTLMPGGSAGTAGQVLQSNGAGAAPTWVTNSGATAWVHGGNTLSSMQRFGTLSNFDIPFVTNNTERMRLTATGNIGIANLTPTEKLDITGNLRLSGAFMPNNQPGTSGFVLTSAGAGTAPTWQDPNAYVISNAWLQGGNTVGSLKTFGTKDNFDLSFITANTEAMRLTTTNRLGLGTNAPTEKLEVKDGNIKLSGTAAKKIIFAGMAGDADASIALRSTMASEQQEMLFHVGNDNNNNFGPDRIRMVSEEFRFQTFNNPTNNTPANAESEAGANTRFLINPAGNVAIGTNAFDASNPEQLLVNGGTTNSYNLINSKASINNYLQFNIQNQSAGNAASTDIVATANNGTETTNYVDLGINGGGYNGNFFGAANDAYLYSAGQDFLVGNATTGKSIHFMTGGSSKANDTRMLINGNGNVGIGTQTPASKLHVQVSLASNIGSNQGLTVENTNAEAAIQLNPGGMGANFNLAADDGSNGFRIYENITERFRISPGGSAYIGSGTPNTLYKLHVDGSVLADSYFTTSDKRLKTNINNLAYGLKEVVALKPVSYKFKDANEGTTRLGLLAQDVHNIIPEIVTKDRQSDYLRMNYVELVPVLINAIKEQQSQIEALKQQQASQQNTAKELDGLKEDVKLLLDRIKALETKGK